MISGKWQVTLVCVYECACTNARREERRGEERSKLRLLPIATAAADDAGWLAGSDDNRNLPFLSVVTCSLSARSSIPHSTRPPCPIRMQQHVKEALGCLPEARPRTWVKSGGGGVVVQNSDST